MRLGTWIRNPECERGFGIQFKVVPNAASLSDMTNKNFKMKIRKFNNEFIEQI
jgi:hypothetical protein